MKKAYHKNFLCTRLFIIESPELQKYTDFKEQSYTRILVWAGQSTKILKSRVILWTEP